MSASTSRERPTGGGSVLPELVLRGLTGTEFNLAALRGRRAVIFCFASW